MMLQQNHFEQKFFADTSIRTHDFSTCIFISRNCTYKITLLLLVARPLRDLVKITKTPTVVTDTNAQSLCVKYNRVAVSIVEKHILLFSSLINSKETQNEVP